LSNRTENLVGNQDCLNLTRRKARAHAIRWIIGLVACVNMVGCIQFGDRYPSVYINNSSEKSIVVVVYDRGAPQLKSQEIPSHSPDVAIGVINTFGGQVPVEFRDAVTGKVIAQQTLTYASINKLSKNGAIYLSYPVVSP